MKIINLAWVLPRPNKSQYIGSFPLHFENRLLDLLRLTPGHLILHPFGGKAEHGLRCDLNLGTNPDVIANAHNLPFQDNTFDLVILDPPYSTEYAKRLYKTPPVKFKQYSKEAVRVTKEGGYIVLYHFIALPRIPDTELTKRIFIETRVWHKLRCVHIHRKNTYAWKGNRGQGILL